MGRALALPSHAHCLRRSPRFLEPTASSGHFALWSPPSPPDTPHPGVHRLRRTPYILEITAGTPRHPPSRPRRPSCGLGLVAPACLIPSRHVLRSSGPTRLGESCGPGNRAAAGPEHRRQEYYMMQQKLCRLSMYLEIATGTRKANTWRL